MLNKNNNKINTNSYNADVAVLLDDTDTADINTADKKTTGDAADINTNTKKITDDIANKKTTIIKKITVRENIAILWIFENIDEYLQTGKVRFDFSDFDECELAEKKKFYFKVNTWQKQIIDRYLDSFVQGVSLGAYLGTLKRKSKTNSTNGINNTNTTPPADIKVAADGRKCLDNAPVLTDDERQALASADREPKVIAGNFSEYPFILDPNQDLSCDNVDMPMLLSMIEQGKISVDEIRSLVGIKYNKLFSLSPSCFRNMPDKYLGEVDIAGCIIEAKNFYERYKEVFDSPEPSEDEVLDRYFEYLKRVLKPVKADTIDKITVFADILQSIDYDTVTFCDEDHIDCESIKYDDVDSLRNDIICYYSKFVDIDRTFNVFGKNTTIKKIVKQMYKKYPNGLNGNDFYKSGKEAYFAGALE